jgi:tripartite-type tricarboxylate transporter receptor subunit TctC
MRTHWLTSAIIGLLLTPCDLYAQQSFPTKPIRLIVAFPPGGPPDITARMLAPKLSETFGVPIIVDNRVGDSGAIGTETAVRANADGYTLILVSASYAANAALHKLSYHPVTDVTPIALIGEVGLLVSLQPSAAISNIAELIAFDKTNPGKLNFGSGGTGSAIHLSTELFNQMAATRMTHAPYPGSGAALNGLLGGQIQIYFGPLPLMITQVKSKRLRAIGVTTLERSRTLPDIPAVAETVAGYEAVQWQALLGPKGLPEEVVQRWNNEINRVLQMPDVKERLASDGMEAAGGSPARFGEVLKRDSAKWEQVVRRAGIKPSR